MKLKILLIVSVIMTCLSTSKAQQDDMWLKDSMHVFTLLSGNPSVKNEVYYEYYSDGRLRKEMDKRRHVNYHYSESTTVKEIDDTVEGNIKNVVKKDEEGRVVFDKTTRTNLSGEVFFKSVYQYDSGRNESEHNTIYSGKRIAQGLSFYNDNDQVETELLVEFDRETGLLLYNLEVKNDYNTVGQIIRKERIYHTGQTGSIQEYTYSPTVDSIKHYFGNQVDDAPNTITTIVTKEDTTITTFFRMSLLDGYRIEEQTILVKKDFPHGAFYDQEKYLYDMNSASLKLSLKRTHSFLIQDDKLLFNIKIDNLDENFQFLVVQREFYSKFSEKEFESPYSKELDDIAIFPNPINSGDFVIAYSERSFSGIIEIFDSKGMLYSRVKTGSSDKMIFEVPNMKGIYFLRFSISEGKETVTKKLIVH